MDNDQICEDVSVFCGVVSVFLACFSYIYVRGSPRDSGE